MPFMFRRCVRAATLAVLLGRPCFAQEPAREPAAQPQAPPAPAPAGGLRAMSLDECIAIAVQKNVDARSSDLEVEAARATRAGARGEFLPKVRGEGNILQWNSAFQLPFALPGTSGPPPVLTVRDAFTWTGAVSVIQPVTPLFAIYDRYKVEDLGVDVATLQRDVTRRDVAFRTAEAYFRVLEATRLAEVAAASVTQLEAQQKQAQSLYGNGVIGKNDLLRADLALAGARQRAIQTRGQVVLVRSRLATLMGVMADAPIDAAPFTGDTPTSDATMEAAEARAVSQRLELREVDRRIDQADARHAFAQKKLLPVVNAVGNYTHTEGSAFAQKDAAYVGLTGTWDVWDWGTTWSGIGEADARRQQARIARTKLEEELRLETRQAFVNAETAKEALAVARTALTQAEENYRIVTKRFEASASTSFDVVDAEALLTQARAQVETALYGHFVARVALQRATGAMSPRLR